jgi:hypothetical protein
VKRAQAASSAYEVLMRFESGREELRLADHLGAVGGDEGSLLIRGERWRVVGRAPAARAGFVARLVCERDGR